MWKDKSPKKPALLAALFVIVLIAFAVYFSWRAQASERFLPIAEITTPKGISVWLVEDHALPIISMKFMFIDSGTANDPADKQGLARLLSNTMDEGAGELDAQEFQKALSDHSITLYFTATRDAFGGEMKTLSRHKGKAFDLLALSLNEPRFDEEAIDRMRAANLSRIKSSLSEPDWMAARLINDRAFENHPYGMNSGGTIRGLQSIKAEDLRGFKSKFLTRDRLIVAIAGDITKGEAVKAIDSVFASLPEKGPAPAVQDTIPSNPGKKYLFKSDIPQTFIEIAMPSFDVRDQDYHALQVMNYILGGAGFGSRLMDEAREKAGLTYGIYSSLQEFRHADILSISTSTKNEAAGQMLSVIRGEMEKLAQGGVSAQELSDAKSYITGSMPLSLTSTDTIADMMISMRMRGLSSDYLDNFAANIKAVTAEDVQRVAARILKPETMTIALVGQPDPAFPLEEVKELPNVR